MFLSYFTKLYINKFSSNGNYLKKRFKTYLLKTNTLRLLYGGLKKQELKKILMQKNNKQSIKKRAKIKNQNLNTNTYMATLLERRLDVILYRTKFCVTVRQAKQLINHGHVLLNGKKVKNNSKVVEKGDVVAIQKNLKSRKLIEQNLSRSVFWPIPTKFLHINYRTLTIVSGFDALETEILFLPFYYDFNFVRNNVRFK